MQIGMNDEDGNFKPVKGYEDRYIVSDCGVVCSIKRTIVAHGKLFNINRYHRLTPSEDKKGYLIVNLYDGSGKRPKSAKVHRLVAEAFIPNPENKRCVCHKDNNPQNCKVENLYWGTDKENQEQAWSDGLHKNKIAVKQMDLNGNEIARFESMQKASRKTNIPQANIWKCIVGERKTAGGSKWQKLD